MSDRIKTAVAIPESAWLVIAEIEWLDGSKTQIADGNDIRDPQDGTFVIFEKNAEGKRLAAHNKSGLRIDGPPRDGDTQDCMVGRRMQS